MCKAVEDYAKSYAEDYAKEQRIEGNVKTVKNLLKDGIPLDKALKYAELDKETYEKYAERVQ